MKAIEKLTIELEEEEYETLIKAQTIWRNIADKLDSYNCFTYDIEKTISCLDDNLEFLLNTIKDGVYNIRK